MNLQASALVLATLLIFPRLSAATRLEDVYQATLRRSESVALQQILVEQSENTLSRARAQMAPQFDSGANYTYQGRDGSSTQDTSSLVRVGVRQPLYRGGALSNGLRIAKIDLSRAKTTAEQNRWQLWWLVTQTYYNVLRDEKGLQNLQELESVVGRRFAEIRRRTQLGRSRAADSQSTLSQRQALLAQIQALKTQVSIGRMQLSQLSGITDLGALEKPTPLLQVNTAVTTKNSRTSSESVHAVGAPDFQRRPDLKIRVLNEQRAASEVDLAEGTLFPELDLYGNYYPYRNDSFATAQNSLRWEAGLQLRWILDFEEINFSARKDRDLNRQAEEIRRREAERASREEFERRLELARGLERQSQELNTAVASSDRALKALQTDFRNGTVGLLDVVSQENAYWELKSRADTLVYDRDLLAWEILWLEGKAPSGLQTLEESTP